MRGMKPTSTIPALRQAGRNLTAPFRLQLGSLTLPQPLEIQTIHRLLPGKRLTAKALWCGRSVLIKLFFDRFGYRRHWHREARGLTALRDAGIATPRILAQAENRSAHAAVLITEYLADAHTLAELRDTPAAHAAAIGATLAMLGRMHAAGLEQRDIHPGNFLWAQERIYSIDGDAITPHPAPLSEAAATANLALFLAQFPPRQSEALLARLGAESAINTAALMQQIHRQRDARWCAYRRKLLRDCTEIRCETDWQRFLAVRRDADDAPLRELLADPDRYIAAGSLLKDGQSSTVALVHLPGRSVVVKRYNLKNRRHRLARCLRPSRARHSWLNAHHLALLGIATPPPLAFFERRFGPLRGTAYYVAEYVAGEALLHKLKNKVVKAIMQPVVRLFAELWRGGLSHGDMKASNLLAHEDTLYLLDLDAMRRHTDAQRLSKAYQKDRRRFLQNWPDKSPIRRWFDANLPRM